MMSALIFAMLFAIVESYSSGPPLSACTEMLPSHGRQPQVTSSPYTITLNDTIYDSNTVIQVTVTATSSTFRGLFIQARSDNSNVAVGTFSLGTGESYLQLLGCNGNAASAIAHSRSTETSVKTFHWTAPAQSVGNIYFRGTFVQSQPVFWTGVSSVRLTAAAKSSMIPTISDMTQPPKYTNTDINTNITSTSTIRVQSSSPTLNTQPSMTTISGSVNLRSAAISMFIVFLGSFSFF